MGQKSFLFFCIMPHFRKVKEYLGTLKSSLQILELKDYSIIYPYSYFDYVMSSP